MKILMAAIVVVTIGLSVASAAPYVILPNGNKVQGTSVQVKDDGTILLSTPQGVLTFKKGTVVFVDEPSEYSRAIQLIQQKQYDQAVDLLRKVISQYRFLQWDTRARVLLAGVYVKQGKLEDAVQLYELAAGQMPDAIDEPGVRQLYLQALMDTGRTEKALGLLEDAITSGSRKEAAEAQLVRGNLRLEQADVENALYDFLRTAELFRDIPETQAEAHYMTAVCFDKLGDERASTFYANVVNDFADSPFAAKAKAELK